MWIVAFSQFLIFCSYIFAELVHFLSTWALEGQLNGENTEWLVHILLNYKLINLRGEGLLYGWTPLECCTQDLAPIWLILAIFSFANLS